MNYICYELGDAFSTYRMGIRSISTLLPVLGITWLFGFLSVSEDVIVFQYIFAILNSLQVCF